MHSWEIKVKVLGEKGWGSSTHHQTNHPKKSRGRAINRWPPVSITVSPLTQGAKWKKKEKEKEKSTPRIELALKITKEKLSFLLLPSLPPSCCPYVVLIRASSGERQVCCLCELACREDAAMACNLNSSQVLRGSLSTRAPGDSLLLITVSCSCSWPLREEVEGK